MPALFFVVRYDLLFGAEVPGFFLCFDDNPSEPLTSLAAYILRFRAWERIDVNKRPYAVARSFDACLGVPLKRGRQIAAC